MLTEAVAEALKIVEENPTEETVEVLVEAVEAVESEDGGGPAYTPVVVKQKF